MVRWARELLQVRFSPASRSPALTILVMAIRVLLDHGIPESNITFLAYLVSRRGLASVHRAFPAIQVVTAAIDPDLHEMHFPLGNAVLGEAAGEGDYSVSLIDKGVSGLELSPDPNGYEDVDGYEVDNSSLKPPAPLGGFEVRRDRQDQEGLSPLCSPMEELKFSRGKEEVREVQEKRAWVVSPGKCRSYYQCSFAWQAWVISGKRALLVETLWLLIAAQRSILHRLIVFPGVQVLYRDGMSEQRRGR